jgi:hypothetical protein
MVSNRAARPLVGITVRRAVYLVVLLGLLAACSPSDDVPAVCRMPQRGDVINVSVQSLNS